MTQREKMVAGELYFPADKDLADARLKARELFFQFNNLPPALVEERALILRQLFAKCPENILIEPPFYCDYGFNIFIEDNFFANFNLVILDCAPVKIGKNVMFAPNVGIYTATHPLESAARISGAEYALPITIGDNVWVGGGVRIMPGVNIGNDAVIGAGSVVTKDIPAGMLGYGNPCRVVRPV